MSLHDFQGITWAYLGKNISQQCPTNPKYKYATDIN